jgi:hypothetical protein
MDKWGTASGISADPSDGGGGLNRFGAESGSINNFTTPAVGIRRCQYNYPSHYVRVSTMKYMYSFFFF